MKMEKSMGCDWDGEQTLTSFQLFPGLKNSRESYWEHGTKQ